MPIQDYNQTMRPRVAMGSLAVYKDVALTTTTPYSLDIFKGRKKLRGVLVTPNTTGVPAPTYVKFYDAVAPVVSGTNAHSAPEFIFPMAGGTVPAYIPMNGIGGEKFASAVSIALDDDGGTTNAGLTSGVVTVRFFFENYPTPPA